MLIDFWTFSCVNCVRTIPHLKVLYDAYKSQRLRHRRRPLAGVRLREGPGQRRRRREAPRGHVAGRHRQRDGHLERVPEPVLAGRVPARPAGPRRVHELRRGRLHADRRGGGAAARRHTAALPSSTPVPANTTPELYAGSGRGQLADNEAYGALGAPSAVPGSRPAAEQDAIQVTGTWTDEGQYLQADAHRPRPAQLRRRHRLHRRRHARSRLCLFPSNLTESRWPRPPAAPP